MNPPNDDFLYALRQQPDPDFARALYHRLRTTKSKPNRARRWLSAAAVVGVIFAALIAASPEVRAQISQQIERLFYGDVELRVISQERISGPGSYGRPPEHLSPIEAQAMLAHQTPTWTPEGLIQEEFVSLIRWSDKEFGIAYRWLDANGELQVHLAIWNNAAPQIVIGQESNSREIEINGHEGTIYNGGWEDGVWTPESSTNLVWVIDGVTYFLSSETLSQSDLLRIAESVQ